MRSCAGTYYLIVLEDTKLEKIVASGTLIVEQKFIHEACCGVYNLVTCMLNNFCSLRMNEICTVPILIMSK